MLHDGILVIDNSCLRHLAKPEARNRFFASARIARVTPRPSDLNLTEAVATPSKHQRNVLLRTVRAIAGDYPLLPWPLALLEKIGQAILAGERGFPLDETGHEYLLDDAEEAQAQSEAALRFMSDLEMTYSQLHQAARPNVQLWMKDREARDYWTDAEDFLAGFWRSSDMRQWLATMVWKRLELPGDAPTDILMQNEAWLLFLDGEGFMMYQRGIEVQQTKKVQRADLMQLVYLAASARRLIVTADTPLLHAATAILHRAYLNSRAVHIQTMIS